MRDWLDKVFPNGILGWGAWHMICHPWKAIPEIADRIKWAWQRVFRGWDDTVTWSIDMHLNEMLPQWLRILRDYGLGAPGCMFDPEDWDEEKFKHKPGALERAKARWHDILTRMIDGFEAGYRLDRFEWQNDDERKQLEAQLDEALKLFVEYYRCLWD